MPTKRFSTRSTRPTPCSPAICVELREQRRPGRARSPSIATASPFSNSISITRGSFGRFARIARALEHRRVGLAPRILEHAAFVAGVQQVAIDRVRLVRRRLDRDRVLLRVLDQLAAALELPLAPRRDDLDARAGSDTRRARSGPGRCPCRSSRARSRRRPRPRRPPSGRARCTAARARCRAGTGLRTARRRAAPATRSRARTRRAGRGRPPSSRRRRAPSCARPRDPRPGRRRRRSRRPRSCSVSAIQRTATRGVETTGVGEHDLANVRHAACTHANAGCRAGTADTGDDTPRAAACPRRRGSRRSTACRRSATAGTPRAG